MKTIFVITALTEDFGQDRTFGFYFSEPEALKAVKENRGSMCESLYHYLVIEEIGAGIHAEANAKYWFVWDDDQSAWATCPTPAGRENVTNYAIG